MGGRAPGGRGGSLGAVWKALCLEDGRGALWTARRGAERGPGCGRDVDGTSPPRALLLALSRDHPRDYSSSSSSRPSTTATSRLLSIITRNRQSL